VCFYICFAGLTVSLYPCDNKSLYILIVIIVVQSGCVEVCKRIKCHNICLLSLTWLDINSQFVCKGPIHKLLSQLAIRFEHHNSWSADNECQNRKRGRSQPCPAYILNLRCPRSLYVLSFEPSKTYVEFKVAS
jgi:hypothetical protein